MTRILKCLIAAIVLIPVTDSCSIIFEEDLSGESIDVIMPVSGTVSADKEQVFWWEAVPGAIKYTVQIVSGSFREPVAIVADTNITGDKYRLELEQGQYEWRINAWNNYSETDYFYFNLTVTDTITR